MRLLPLLLILFAVSLLSSSAIAQERFSDGSFDRDSGSETGSRGSGNGQYDDYDERQQYNDYGQERGSYDERESYREYDDYRGDYEEEFERGRERYDDYGGSRDYYEDYEEYSGSGEYGTEHRMSEEDERKFRAFESALEDLGHSTAGLREMIESEDLSKAALFERFGREDVMEAVKAAGVEDEFSGTPDIRYGDARFEDPLSYRFAPPKGEQMYGLVFQHIAGEINPSQLSRQCSDPDAIVDDLMALLKSRISDFSSACDEVSDNAAECRERIKNDCSRIGMPHPDEFEGDELRRLEMEAFSCPPDEGSIIDVCVKRSLQYNQERLEFVDEICEDRWTYGQDRIQRDCNEQQRYLQCDKSEFVEECLGGMRPEDFEEEYYEDEYYDEGFYEEDYYEGEEKHEGSQFDEQDREHEEEFFDGEFDDDGFEEEHGDFEEGQDGIDEETGGGGEEAPDEGRQGDTPEHEYSDTEPEPEQEEAEDDSGSDGGEEGSGGSSDDSIEEDTRSGDDGSDGDGSAITGNVVLETYDDFVEQCERDFEDFEEPECERVQEECSRSGFIEQCIRNEKEWAADSDVEVRISCRIESRRMMREAERNCDSMGRERERCMEEASRHCEQITDVASECRENLQESKVREFLEREVRERCEIASELDIGRRDADTYEVVVAVAKFASDEDFDEITDLLGNSEKLLTLEDSIVIKGKVARDDVEMLKTMRGVQRYKVANLAEESGSASKAAKSVANRLANLGGDELPSDIAYIVDSEAVDLADVSRKLAGLEDLEEEKNIAYKFRRFFGMVKDAEEREVAQLEQNGEKLSESIESLKSAAAKVEDPVAKAVLLEQVEVLRGQQESISSLIIGKQKKALGFFGFFS